MRAQDWMTTDVRTCSPETSLNDAADHMWRGDCGILPVLDGERVVGVITDRDACMGAYLAGRVLADIRVRDAMASKVFTCRTTDSIEDVLRCMSDHQVRRIPIVDGRGTLAGILSVNDLARHILALTDGRERARIEARFVEALASICATRSSATVPETTSSPDVARRPLAAGRT